MIVCNYFLDSENYIKGWELLNSERKDKKNDTEYQSIINLNKENEFPLKEMVDFVSDENKRLFNKELKRNYKLINNKIEIIERENTTKEEFYQKYSVLNIIKKIVAGINNGKNDPEFIELVNDINNMEV